MNQVIVQECTTVTDIICECSDGSFLRSANEGSCEGHSKCPPGAGVIKEGVCVNSFQVLDASKATIISSYLSTTVVVECLQSI